MNEDENCLTTTSYLRQRHLVDLVLIFGLVLAKGTVALEQFVQHTAEGEPVGRGIVRDAFGEHLGRHVPVRSDARVRLLLRVVARQAQIRHAHVTVLVQQDVCRLKPQVLPVRSPIQ